MLSIEKFQEIRLSNHLIAFDASVLLELYREPANISLDVIDALKRIQNNIYIPRQAYDEYIKNYHKIRGDEKKKYIKVTQELSNSLNHLKKDISIKIGEYRKHNYTDISKLHDDLDEKIKEAQSIITSFEDSHSADIQLNVDFLEDDKVKKFVDLLEIHGNVGPQISFSKRLLLLQEGQVRFDNLIPPGFLDTEKDGEARFGDLFVWKDIITIAKEKNSNIIFVCNDTKEDWWEKDKKGLIDLRGELDEEFKETNPSLHINFLTLDKFFSYLSEELKIGKSKSALQLSAMEDIKTILDDYEDEIYQGVGEYLCTLDIQEELDEEFLESGDKNIYWNVIDVSVDKENKEIIYYVNLDISVLADLFYHKPGEYPCNVGKIALSLNGYIEVLQEEYSTFSVMKTLHVEKGDILHIEPEIWMALRDMDNQISCKGIIDTSKEIIKRKQFEEALNATFSTFEYNQAMQQHALLFNELAKSTKPQQINGEINGGTRIKAMEPIRIRQFNYLR